MKKILVPNDFSEYSKRAFLYAKNIAEKTGAEIILLHCYHIESSIGINPSEEELKKFEDTTRESHFNKLNSFLATVSSIHKCKFKSLLEEGLPVDTIILITEKENIDFIVMGARGETNLFERIFGSVTEKVTNAVKCPTLVVPEGNSPDNINNIIFFTSLNKKKILSLTL